MISSQELARYFDHTILKPEATESDVQKICDEALAHHFFSVCVNPSHVEFCKNYLRGSDVKIATVVGFPLGATTTEVKAFEAAQGVAAGADEIDMVLNVGALKSGDFERVRYDIMAVVKASAPALVKVILETCLLTDDEKRRACELSVAAGAHFVKTSTGFSKSGATVADIKLMRTTVGPKIGVKASGGVRTLSDAVALIDAGASRLGASASVAILKEIQDKK